ncbi:MAG: cyclodeaminase/cyclohydrolase family protein [Tissierellia bacterium]|nr:cyclodeaminase/cyclohydrolase family protein [Tissierellia bacterium]
MNLKDYTLTDFIAKATDTSSLPGGGSICALNGALAASLGIMVLGLSRKKIQAPEKVEKLRALSDELRENIEADGRSFEGVLEGLKMPKETPEEAALRSRAIQEGYQRAMEVPHSTVLGSLEVLKILASVAKDMDPYAYSDLRIARDLAMTAIHGALYTMDLNLPHLSNEEKKEHYRRLMEEEEEMARAHAIAIEQTLQLLEG